MKVTPAQLAGNDQEEAEARHEASMIALVYERLAISLPEDFARTMTLAWWQKPEPGEDVDVTCDECGAT